MRLMEPCLGVVVIVEREIYGHCECESRKELMIRALSQVYEAVASQLNWCAVGIWESEGVGQLFAEGGGNKWQAMLESDGIMR